MAKFGGVDRDEEHCGGTGERADQSAHGGSEQEKARDVQEHGARALDAMKCEG